MTRTRDASVPQLMRLPAARPPATGADPRWTKISGSACVVCHKTNGLTPTHLVPESECCDHVDCVVPMCFMHRRAFHAGRINLLPYLEPCWRIEIAHAVMHLGLITGYRRLTGGRLPSTDT